MVQLTHWRMIPLSKKGWMKRGRIFRTLQSFRVNTQCTLHKTVFQLPYFICQPIFFKQGTKIGHFKPYTFQMHRSGTPCIPFTTIRETGSNVRLGCIFTCPGVWINWPNYHTLWIQVQVPPKKMLSPPNCTLGAFPAADPWIHRDISPTYISLK